MKKVVRLWAVLCVLQLLTFNVLLGSYPNRGGERSVLHWFERGVQQQPEPGQGYRGYRLQDSDVHTPPAVGALSLPVDKHADQEEATCSG